MEEAGKREDAMTASNLVAEQDGTVVSMIVREGVPQVTIGQEIKKGDVLVTGNVPVYQEDGTIRKYRYCNADADIVVQHVLPVKETLSLYYEKKNYTGREKKHLELFGKTIRFGKNKEPFRSCDSIESRNQLQLLRDFYLPVIYGNRTYREYYVEERKYTNEESKALIQDEYKKIVESLEEKGVQIIEKNVKIETNDLKWVLSGELTVQEKTGKNVAIEEQIFTDAEQSGEEVTEDE